VYAGNDQKVYFLDKQGNSINRFDFSSDKSVRDFSGAFFNPAGDSVVLTTYSGFLVFTLNPKRNTWEKKMHYKIENYYDICAATWKPDGSQFVIANVCGAIDLFSMSVKKERLNKHFEVNYVANSKVNVIDSRSNKKTVLESRLGAQIENVQMSKFGERVNW
jgi:DNA-binding beta-propeller fold protein YncE